MKKQIFEAKLAAMGPKGSWTHMPIPFNVEQTFGTKARVPVRGTINGFAFRSSIMPRGDGTHYMAINKSMQQGAKTAAGEVVQVTMELDAAERNLEVPADFRKALGLKAGQQFDALAYSHRKEYVDWIEQAKKPETRARRIEKAVSVVAAKKPLKS